MNGLILLTILIFNRLWLGLIFMFFPIIGADVYVPGTPGAEWSEEELMVVKAKLQSIFRRNGGFEAMRQLHADGNTGPWESGSFNGRWSLIPDAPKTFPSTSLL